ncbi:MAG TPA: hypothetical protein VGT61_08605 [Thermomicrobiales bacterium]|nr:hypothetical protein [Thermomicrobiales bacterium]
MSDNQGNEIDAKVAALGEEFPGYEFSWTDADVPANQDDSSGSGRYSVSVREAAGWAGAEPLPMSHGDTIDAAIDAMRSRLRSTGAGASS